VSDVGKGENDVNDEVYHRSDIHFWKAGRIGPLIVESDCVLGHEAAGIVLKVGEGVKDFVVGELLCLFFSAPLFSSFSSALILVSLSFSSSLLSFLGRGWFRKVLFIVCKYWSGKEQEQEDMKEKERAEYPRRNRKEREEENETEIADKQKTGDRVAVEPGVPCENCWLCREGRYNLCENVKFSGVWPYHGTLQRFKVHPAKWLHK
jgi:hypothetical protein